MDLNQCKIFFDKMYSGKKVEYNFDEKCQRVIAFLFTDGLPNTAHHIECDQVKISVEGLDDFYVPIVPCKSMGGFDYMRKVINQKADFYLNPGEKESLLKIKKENEDEFNKRVDQLAESLGMHRELILMKLV
jgi:hypothetical protein